MVSTWRSCASGRVLRAAKTSHPFGSNCSCICVFSSPYRGARLCWQHRMRNAPALPSWHACTGGWGWPMRKLSARCATATTARSIWSAVTGRPFITRVSPRGTRVSNSPAPGRSGKRLPWPARRAFPWSQTSAPPTWSRAGRARRSCLCSTKRCTGTRSARGCSRISAASAICRWCRRSATVRR